MHKSTRAEETDIQRLTRFENMQSETKTDLRHYLIVNRCEYSSCYRCGGVTGRQSVEKKIGKKKQMELEGILGSSVFIIIQQMHDSTDSAILRTDALWISLVA